MFLKYQIPAIFWAGLILVASIIPGKDLPQVSLVNFDKIAHLIIYGIFVFILQIGFKKQTELVKVHYNSASYAFVIALIYGTVIEVIQELFFVERFFDIFDILANTAGNIAGLIGFYIVYKKT